MAVIYRVISGFPINYIALDLIYFLNIIGLNFICNDHYLMFWYNGINNS